MLNLSEIRVFAVAGETENFSQAARQLHLSQPAVSQQIHSLETYLGVRLFQRSGWSVSLTDEGKVLLPLARKLLNLTSHIEETMRTLEGQVIGHLVIGCTTTAGKYILPLVVAAFRQRYPNVHVTIEMCTDDPVEDLITAQEVHLGVSSAKIVHPAVECRPFFVDHVVLIVPADHPFAQRSFVQPIELLEQPFILREEGSSTYRMLGEALAGHGITLDQLVVAMEVGNAEAIVAAVEYGLGISFTSRLAARHGLASGHLVEVPVEGIYIERPLYVARNARSPKTEAQTRFWDFIAECREEISQMLHRNPLCERFAGLLSAHPPRPNPESPPTSASPAAASR